MIVANFLAETANSARSRLKSGGFPPSARWRSGYAEDCKSTDIRPLSPKVRTIHAPFYHGVPPSRGHHCELFRLGSTKLFRPARQASSEALTTDRGGSNG